ncbi:DUF6557 family protein [Bacteroides sp. 224]|uniref:DUF6557 family protein n=1 Tax=Bacteroides sp. 224 TaxID=2302936 RepID=UPI0013D45D18|nr:DUF6557 family protein [Bacteroides sp. 224]NDV66336.1 hypothetical protein [Bacteroides sp. 224]
MKLKQLLQNYSFNSIVPHLVRLYPNQAGSIPAYKGAYDILLHTEEVESDEVMAIKRWKDPDNEVYIHVTNCEGDSWDWNLGKELVIEDGIVLSGEELAAHCLWSLTFYGFSPRDKAHAFDEEPNFKNRKQRIEHLIARLTANKTLCRKEINYLHRTKRIMEIPYNSYAYNKEQRLPYLIDLLENYEQNDLSPYNTFILMISTSKENPILASEKEYLSQFTAWLPKGATYRWAFGINEELGEEAELLLVGSY